MKFAYLYHMSEALIFSILLLVVCVYSLLGTFLNWESTKKHWAKGKLPTVFDKILGIILTLMAVSFLVFVMIKGL